MTGGGVGTGTAIGASFAGGDSGTGGAVCGVTFAQEMDNNTEVTNIAPIINFLIFMCCFLRLLKLYSKFPRTLPVAQFSYSEG